MFLSFVLLRPCSSYSLSFLSVRMYAFRLSYNTLINSSLSDLLASLNFVFCFISVFTYFYYFFISWFRSLCCRVLVPGTLALHSLDPWIYDYFCCLILLCLTKSLWPRRTLLGVPMKLGGKDDFLKTTRTHPPTGTYLVYCNTWLLLLLSSRCCWLLLLLLLLSWNKIIPFYPASSVHPESVLIPYPREILILWSRPFYPAHQYTQCPS